MFVRGNDRFHRGNDFIFVRIFTNTIRIFTSILGIGVHYLRRGLCLRGNTVKLFVRAGKERERKKEKSNNASYWQLLMKKKKKRKKRSYIIVWKIISCSLIVNPMGTVPIQYPGCLKESRIINFYEVRSKKKDIILRKILFVVSLNDSR